MNETKYQKLFQLFNDDESKNYLEEQAIRFSSTAAAGMFLWVKGQMSLYLVNKDLTPKRQALDQANQELQVVLNSLAQKQMVLDQVQQKVRDLNLRLDEIVEKKKQLEDSYQTSNI